MNPVKPLTVADALKLPQFERSILLAGKEGLNKTVSWVHVLEHVYIKEFINGNEIILTTGARWQNDDDPLIFLEQLIENSVSALCIQLGPKYNRFSKAEELPKPLLAKAEAHNFPLLVFPEAYDCRFIDLIHDIHAVIINRNYEDDQKRDRWVNKWLAGQLGKQEIEMHLQKNDPFYNPKGCSACLINFARPLKQDEQHLERLHRMNSIAGLSLQQNGFKLFCSIEEQTLVYVLTGARQTAAWKSPLMSSLQNFLKTTASRQYLQNNEINFISIGGIYAELDRLKQSYDNAQDTFYLQSILGEPMISLYEDMGVYTIVLALDKTGELDGFINRHLRPILHNKSPRNNILLQTLIALRDCRYNKIEAARRLFISRQSIYQRIKTLENMLGDDFLSNVQVKICIEIALYGLHYQQKMKLR